MNQRIARIAPIADAIVSRLTLSGPNRGVKYLAGWSRPPGVFMVHPHIRDGLDGPDDVKQRRHVLKEHGLRATPSRVAVLGVLNAATAPLSHGDVVRALSPFGGDRATIYRNLLDFVRVGLAVRTDLGDRVWRFELAKHHDKGLCDHPHFVCTACGDVACMPGVSVALRRREGIPSSLKAREVEIQIRGLCDHCREA